MDRDNRTRTGAKDPWGRAAPTPLACTEAGMPGAGLTAEVLGKARPDRLALKPYRGKPAVRNFREGDGDGGIMRSPLRAIALPDPPLGARAARGLGGRSRRGKWRRSHRRRANPDFSLKK